MERKRCDIAIIGSGTAGLHAYKKAVERGQDAILIDRGEQGSTCTRNGCIPSKLLIAAARAAHGARAAGTFGIVVAGVEVDGAAVMDRVRAESDRRDGQIRDEFEKVPADHRITGSARLTSPTTLVADGVEVSAAAIVLATGSTPIVPDFLDPVRDLVRTNEDIFDVARPPASLAVIGAGPLGLELAQAFARLGTRVSVLDKGGTVGALADPEAETLAREMLGREIDVHTGIDITAERAGDRARLSWDGGSVEVDMVLAATGRAPATKDLGLDAAGIATDDHGAPLFDHATRRCGDAPVYVAGDVGGWRPVLHEAARGGSVAAEVAADAPPRRPLPELAVAFTEPNLCVVGTGFDDLPDGALIGTARAGDNARAGIDGEEDGIVRLYAAPDGTLLGGTIVLTGGEHLAQSLVIAIDAGMEAMRFTDQAWYHPVLEELLQEAARDIVRQRA